MANQNKSDLMLLILRIFSRIISFGFVGMFLYFLLGEGNLQDYMKLNTTEIILLLFIPILFIIGVVISWKREFFGGILIFTSVIGFNGIDVLATKHYSGNLQFCFLLIPGILLILLALIQRINEYRWKERA